MFFYFVSDVEVLTRLSTIYFYVKFENTLLVIKFCSGYHRVLETVPHGRHGAYITHILDLLKRTPALGPSYSAWMLLRVDNQSFNAI